MNEIRVLMVEDASNIAAVKKYVVDNGIESLKIVASFTDGLVAKNYLMDHSNEVDLILMDTVLPSLDGLGLLAFMKENDLQQKVIVHSYFTSSDLVYQLSLYGVSFLLDKHTDLSIVMERIFNAMHLDTTVTYDHKKELSKLLHDLGMPSHIKGYQYIRDSIELMYQNPDSLGGITKSVYPFIAKKYDTTASRVERAIRHAIEVSWSRGDYDLMEELFGHSVDYDRAKPTNSEFLATLTDKILLDEVR